MARRGPQAQRDITGADVYEILKDAYTYGRVGGSARDYTRPQRAPVSKPPQPGRDEYAGTFQGARNSHVSPAPDESAPQFPCEKVADHNDTREAWLRGMGNQAPHPHFDSGPSGHTYRRK